MSSINSKSSSLTNVAFGSTPNSNGGVISGNTLTLEPADGSNPGGVSTAAQTFAGDKTFGSVITTTTYANLVQHTDPINTGQVTSRGTVFSTTYLTSTPVTIPNGNPGISFAQTYQCALYDNTGTGRVINFKLVLAYEYTVAAHADVYDVTGGTMTPFSALDFDFVGTGSGITYRLSVNNATLDLSISSQSGTVAPATVIKMLGTWL